MLETVKKELRVTNTAFDDEIQGLIDSAKADLMIPQIDPVTIDEGADPLIKRAIILYCKAHFGLDNKDSEKYMISYNNLVEKLSLSLLYKDVID